MNRLTRRMAARAPRSTLLGRISRLYSRHDDASGENDGDPATNGEHRFLQEVVPLVSVAFDIGANVGDWTSKLLDVAGRGITVHAFEPSRATFQMLAERPFPDCVHRHQLGMSSQPGEAQLFVAGEGSPLNSLYRREGLEDGWKLETVTSTETILLDSIDHFAEQHAISEIDFVKIDTEGHEVSTLRGAERLLSTGSIEIIQFEYGGAYIDSRCLLKDVFDLLAGAPYTVFLILPRGLRACPRYDQRLENFQYKNFAVIRNDVAPTIASARRGERHG